MMMKSKLNKGQTTLLDPGKSEGQLIPLTPYASAFYGFNRPFTVASYRLTRWQLVGAATFSHHYHQHHNQLQ